MRRFINRMLRHGEAGGTLIELLIASMLGVMVLVLVSTLMFNTQTYVNRQVATSQLLANVSSSMNKVVDSLDSAQPLGYCPSSQGSNKYTTIYKQCPHVSEEGSALWAATPKGACWFVYLSSLVDRKTNNPSLDGQAPDLQCMYEVPYTGSTSPPQQDQYNLWVVSWPARSSASGVSPSYTSCQPVPGLTPAGCWIQSGLTLVPSSTNSPIPTAAPSCTSASQAGTAACPLQQQLVARVYSTPSTPLFTYWNSGGCQIGTTNATTACPATPLPNTTSCSNQSPSPMVPWSGCLSVLGSITSVKLNLHLRAAAVNGNYGTYQSGHGSSSPPVLGTVDQQLQLEATLFGQSYYQQQTAVVG